MNGFQLSLRAYTMNRSKKKTAWLQKLIPARQDRITVYIQAEQYYFMRAEVFLDDIQHLAGEVQMSLDIGWLMAVLYEDFLLQIRRGAHIRDIGLRLQRQYQEHYEQYELKPLSSNHYKRSLSSVQSVGKLHRYELSMNRKSALRGEVFLIDCKQVLPEFRCTLPQLLSILFMNFITGIQGDRADEYVEALLDRLSPSLWE